MTIDIINAQYINGYKLKLTFSDQVVRVIDFEPFLTQAHNPMTRRYLDLEEFKTFKVEYGDLIWNDYDLCFPVIDLYENNLAGILSSVA